MSLKGDMTNSDRGLCVAITGGIGSGKSVVIRMLTAMGYPVYDCDSRAKSLMDCSPAIKRKIAEEISAESVGTDGVIDRSVLADVVFRDSEKLQRLNSAVHDAVRQDIDSWRSGRTLSFVETAILYQSGLDRMVDEVWEVIAPRELRIERVMARSGLSREQVAQRMAVQDSYEIETLHPNSFELINDGDCALLPQVESLLANLSARQTSI